MDVFSQCDYNESGYISLEEYMACSGESDHHWKKLLKRFDLNMDHLLSWQEVYNAALKYDKHPLTLTSQDLSQENNAQVVNPT